MRRVGPKLATGVGLAVTAAIILIGLRLIDWPQTFDVLSGISLSPVLAFVVLNITSVLLFALRWRLLIATAEHVPFRRVYDILTIGLLANALLPGRPGDVARAMLLRQTATTPFSAGLASVVLERLGDVMAICVIGFLLLLFVDLPIGVRIALQLFSLAAVTLGVVLVIMNRYKAWFDNLAVRIQWPLATFLFRRLGQFASALGVVREPRRIAVAGAITLSGWAVLSLAVWTLINAFGFGVPPGAAMLVIVATNLGSAIPSAPANIGLYHFLAVLALSVWGVDRDAAVAFAITAHFLSILVHISLGLIAAWSAGITVMRLRALAIG